MNNTERQADIPGQIPEQRSTVFQLWDFMKVRKKWWLAPIIIFLLVISLALALGASTPAGPFVYTLF